METVVSGIHSEDFDSGAKEAWEEITSEAVGNMTAGSVKVISVVSGDEQSLRRKLQVENITTIVTVSIQDTMENYGFNDADDFALHVQTRIYDSQQSPDTLEKFIKKSILKGSRNITTSTKWKIGKSSFTKPAVSRVLTGVPTSAPSREEVPLTILEEIVQDDLYLSLTSIGIIIIVLLIVLCYFHSKKNSDSDDKYVEGATHGDSASYIDVNLGDQPKRGDNRSKVNNEQVALDKFDSMMSKSFRGIPTECDDRLPNERVPKQSIPVRGKDISASSKAYEEFKASYRKELTRPEKLQASRVASFDKSSLWDSGQLSAPRPKAILDSPSKLIGKDKYRPKSSTPTKSKTGILHKSPSFKRSALSQSSLFDGGAKHPAVSLRAPASNGDGRGLSPPPTRTARHATTLPGLHDSYSGLSSADLRKIAKDKSKSKLSYHESIRAHAMKNTQQKSVETLLGSTPPVVYRDDWVERYSDRKQRRFWKNKVTGESTWQNPFGIGSMPPKELFFSTSSLKDNTSRPVQSTKPNLNKSMSDEQRIAMI
jgi:hypothetical protein